MIPVSLRLRNFMCYREGLAPLDLGEIHVACISGPNGAGKSALLDAMTWALWGRARSRSDDALITTGAQEMEVEFEFLLEGNHYRVLRRRDRAAGKGSGKSQLDLQVYAPQGWRSMTGENIRQTEEAITALLRMDYETFINSAFLLQGRADEFTIKPPAERKRILAEILGLSYYDVLEQRARERLRTEERNAQALALLLQDLEQQLGDQAAQEAALSQAQEEAGRLEEEAGRCQEELGQLQTRLAGLEATAHQAEDARRRIAQAEQEAGRLQAQLAQHAAGMERLHELLARADEIESSHTRLLHLREQDQALAQAAGQLLALAERQRTLEQAVERARNSQATEAEILRRSLRESGARLRERPALAERLAELDKKLADLQEQEARRERLREEAQELVAAERTHRAALQRLRDEMAALRGKLDMLAGEASACPLCHSPLDPTSYQHIQDAYQAEGEERRDHYRAHEGEIHQIEERLGEIRGQQEMLAKELKRTRSLEGQRMALDRELQELDRLAQEQTLKEERLQEIEGVLERGDYAPTERAALTALQAEIAGLRYDRGEHDAVQRELAPAKEIEEMYRQLRSARERLAEEQGRGEELQTALQRRRDEAAAEGQRLAEIEAGLVGLPALQQRRQAAEEARRAAQDALGQARLALGAAQRELQRLQEVARAHQEKKKAHQEASERRGIYDELVGALGKRGVQAMLIETAVPEIEREANELLGRMTDGEMALQLAMQRATKQGNIVETLDINISDFQGTRPYETYSVDGQERVYIRRQGLIYSLPIEELWDEKQPYNASDGYELQPAGFDALCYVDGEAAWLPASHILRHPAPRQMLRVKFTPGNYTITLTPNHSILVMTPGGLCVRRTDELHPADLVLTPRHIPGHCVQEQIDFVDYISTEFAQRRIHAHKPLRWDDEQIWSRRDQAQPRGTANNTDWGELLGIATAEASGRTTLTLSLGNDPQMAERVVALSRAIFGTGQPGLGKVSAQTMARYTAKVPGFSCQSPQPQYRPILGGRFTAHIVGNMIGRGAPNKRVPVCIFNAADDTQRAYLRGLIAGDGYIRIRPEKTQVEVAVTTVSRGLVADAIFLCRQLGIWAHVEKHGEACQKRGARQRQSFRLGISGQQNVQKLIGEDIDIATYTSTTKYDGIPLVLLGIQRNGRGKRLRRGALDERFPCGSRVVPRRSREQYERMAHLLRDWAVLEVDTVEEVRPSSGYVYDLVVPGNHSFVAGTGAILVHNSGGESFRINFALRIALSRLLARRAGASLQTLVIDEGFGTQDAEGRARLIEAISSIQAEFEKVLVITHIQELKEAFPVRIEIERTPEGSAWVVR